MLAVVCSKMVGLVLSLFLQHNKASFNTQHFHQHMLEHPARVFRQCDDPVGGCGLAGWNSYQIFVSFQVTQKAFGISHEMGVCHAQCPLLYNAKYFLLRSLKKTF